MLLGIDPGTRKCGYAVVDRLDAPPLALGIVPLGEFESRLNTLRSTFPIDMVAIGGGTNAAAVSSAAALSEKRHCRRRRLVAAVRH